MPRIVVDYDKCTILGIGESIARGGASAFLVDNHARSEMLSTHVEVVRIENRSEQGELGDLHARGGDEQARVPLDKLTAMRDRGHEPYPAEVPCDTYYLRLIDRHALPANDRTAVRQPGEARNR